MDTKPQNRKERRAQKQPHESPAELILPRPPKHVLVGSGEDSLPGDTLVYTGFDDPNWL